MLTKEQIANMKNALYDFVLRVAKGDGTPEEVNALAEVATLLFTLEGELIS